MLLCAAKPLHLAAGKAQVVIRINATMSPKLWLAGKFKENLMFVS
jgi:hypothetical protein